MQVQNIDGIDYELEILGKSSGCFEDCLFALISGSIFDKIDTDTYGALCQEGE